LIWGKPGKGDEKGREKRDVEGRGKDMENMKKEDRELI
jgi:hypothetical protein